jgi:hypothetical protein
MTALGHSRPSFATDPSQQQFRLRPLCCRKRKQIQGYTVARCVRYAAPVVPNELIEDRSALRQSLERADLIGSHETAVAFHVRREDCDELTADLTKV